MATCVCYYYCLLVTRAGERRVLLPSVTSRLVEACFPFTTTHAESRFSIYAEIRLSAKCFSFTKKFYCQWLVWSTIKWFAINIKQDALGAYTCASSWIKCESLWFYWVLTVHARLGFSVAVQYIKYDIKWLKTSTQIKKNKKRGNPKLVPRFAAGTSNRIRKKQMPPLQYGFMQRKGTTNAIFVLRMIMGHSVEKQKDVLICFINYEKTFDKVNIMIWWECWRVWI